MRITVLAQVGYQPPFHEWEYIVITESGIVDRQRAHTFYSVGTVIDLGEAGDVYYGMEVQNAESDVDRSSDDLVVTGASMEDSNLEPDC